MTARILIIEDEAIVAAELSFLLEDLGHEVVGVAADSSTAMKLAAEVAPDLALVDVHLSDGPTGAVLGGRLGAQGVTVVYTTANPALVGAGSPAVLGVLGKPTDEAAVTATVEYALQRRQGIAPLPAPPELRLFS